jgi:ATP-dependent exoDNAse (exonuclease V) beta subunit
MMTLSELVERIDDLKFREAREGEAAIEEAGAVRLMTVHKSKGLEFPVVWIVDATYGGGHSRDIVALHADYGVAVNVKAEGSPAEDDPPAPAFFEMIKRIEEQMDEAEKKRLLYVAATRARDHLIISGATGKSRLLGNHWLGRIASALGLEENDLRNEIGYESGSIAVFRHDAESVMESFAIIASQQTKSAQSNSKTEADFSGNYFPLIGSITR